MQLAIRLTFVLLTLFFLNACASSTPKGPEVGPRLPQNDYVSAFMSRTKTEKKYDGFYQLYETHVTFMDSSVQTAILQRKSDVYRWSTDIAQKEREKLFQENSNSTQFILILYTPRPRLTDLHRKTSIWKVFLEANGQRYESEIKKAQGPFESVQAIYPSHNRFTTAYEVTFKVPLSAIEGQNPKFTLTSSLGTTELDF